MRLRTITAATMTDAMATVRCELGDDAIIVSTESGLKGVKIVAAVEDRADPMPRPVDLASRENIDSDPIEAVHDALLAGGVPGRLAERLVDGAFLSGCDEPLLALAAAIGQVLQFQPLGATGPVQPIMLVGTPGAGKTMAAAKLAARAVLGGRATRLITCDVVRAGAFEQLAAFARLLDVSLAAAERPLDLARAVLAMTRGELVIIDTAGVNPYDKNEMSELAELLRAVPAEPVLVLPAGCDPLDAADQVAAFAPLGVVRVLATRLDASRRLGGIVAAVAEHGLGLTDCSISQSVSDGLVPLDAAALASRLLPDLYRRNQEQGARA